MKRLGLCLLLATLGCGGYPHEHRSGSSGTPDGRPLFVWLHGFTPPSDVYRPVMEERMRRLAEARGWRFIAPEGFTDVTGAIYWPASPACCDRFHEGNDGVARVWDSIVSAQPEGPIFIVGTSNGGFMAHRMMCEMPNQITAAISIAGAGTCALEIHGWEDKVVPFGGGPVRWMELEPALPATAAPELWSGPWGHALPQPLELPMMNYLKAHYTH